MLGSITTAGHEDIEAAMEVGDCELGRDVGERSTEDSRLGWGLKDCRLLVSNVRGLSFPVGPLPKGGLLDGGRLRACRRVWFSVSSSDTLSSNALRQKNKNGLMSMKFHIISVKFRT